MVQDLGLRVQDLGFMAQGLGPEHEHEVTE